MKGLNKRTQELELRVLKGYGVRIMPCALCGEDALHGAVEGRDAELVFRATVDELLGIVWVPVKGHAHPVNCPDPDERTARFWRDHDRRASYKAKRRREAERRRIN